MDNNMDKDIVKDQVIVNKVKKNKKKKDNNNNTGVILIVSILLSFVCGSLSAYLIVSNYSVQSVVKNITTSFN